jgi:hypothetical protein
MNTLPTYAALAALGFAAAGLAQAPETPQPPTPSTSETEGTAADRTAPGKTPTRETPSTDTETHPQPSTSPTEGTAADRTPPGKTPTGGASTAGQEMVGSAVVSSDQTPLGKVVEVVFDAKGQPEFVVIATHQGQTAAVPYKTASAGKSANKVVVDESRLKRAPTLKQGEWRGESDTWKMDSSRYWGKG